MTSPELTVTKLQPKPGDLFVVSIPPDVIPIEDVARVFRPLTEQLGDYGARLSVVTAPVREVSPPEWWGVFTVHRDGESVADRWVTDSSDRFIHYPSREIAEAHAETWNQDNATGFALAWRAEARRFGGGPPNGA